MMHRFSILLLVLSFSCNKPKRESVETSPQVGIEEKSKTKSYKTLDLLSGKIKIDLPEQLRPMEARMFLLKYPMENPEGTNAYSNEDGTVSLLVSPRQDKAVQSDLPKYQKMLYESFGRNSSVDFMKSEIRKINGRDFIVIEMITPAVDTRVYNLMFITSLGGRLLMCTFNCTMDKQREWQPEAQRILSSANVKD